MQNAKIKLPLPFAVWVQIVYTGILDGYVACCTILLLMLTVIITPDDNQLAVCVTNIG